MTGVIWKDLVYCEIDYGERFEISNVGNIRNKKTRRWSKNRWEHLVQYTTIYFDGKSKRIKIGEAQEQSGLPRTVEDRLPELKGTFTREQTYEIQGMMLELLKFHNLVE